MQIGLVKIFQSAKATMALIVLTVSAIVALKGDMSIGFATCVGTVASIWMYVHGQNDRASMNLPK